MKILFLAPRFPRPPFKGDQARGFHQLRLLSQKHEITLVAFSDRKVTESEREAAKSLCRTLIVVRRPRGYALNLFRAPFSSLPLQTLLYASSEYAAAVERELRTGSYDVVHVQLIRMCPYAEKTAIPRVVDLIDALSMNMERRAAGDTPLLRPVIRFEARRVASYERRICEGFEAAIVASPVDRAAIGDYPNLRVIPIGVEPQALTLPAEPRETDLIVFTGTMNYFPNIEAAQILVRDILPVVRRSRPDARLQIVGAHPPQSVRDLASVPGVEVTGFVPSVFPYLQRATVAVSPMRFGSRTQFKVLEAMAACTPVVATMAAGGQEVEDEVHLLIGDDTESLAEKIVRVLTDPDLAARLGRAGGDLVREKYTWQASVSALEQVYESVSSARGEHQRSPEEW